MNDIENFRKKLIAQEARSDPIKSKTDSERNTVRLVAKTAYIAIAMLSLLLLLGFTRVNICYAFVAALPFIVDLFKKEQS